MLCSLGKGFSVYFVFYKFMGSGMDRKFFVSEDNLCVKCNKKCSLIKIYFD